jgi:hypothetical protein
MRFALPVVLAQADLVQGQGLGTTVVEIAVLVLLFAGMWKVFQKAGKPGWAAIIPIYNIIILLEITGKPLWWIVLYFIPVVNFVVVVLVCIELAKRFGKGAAFGIGVALLPFIFYPILGFGDATYGGASGAMAPAAAVR